jgi:phycoerythrin-associated linker protein
MLDYGKQIKAWIRSQHLICDGTDFIFETVDQTQLEKFELCIESMGSKVPCSESSRQLANGTETII